MINDLIRYFDLQSRFRDDAIGVGDKKSLTVFPQYIAASLGVIFEPYLSMYANTGAIILDPSSFLTRTIFGFIVGIAILPAVYKSSFNDKEPKLVQFGTLFVAGLGWQSIVASAAKLGG